jgi:4-hydroxybenzoate polyprenyltransferase
MPIVLGKKAASIIAFILTIIFAAAIYIYIYDKFFKELIITLYFLISVIGPLLFTGVLMLLAKTTKDFHQISNILKLVMLFGMLSLLLYQLILMK